jgi:hypothetical protein
MIVIQTQYRENYGTSTEPYWKNKGGEEYKVTNIPSMTAENVTSMVMSVRPLIEKDNEYQQENIIGWSIEPDTYLSSFEQSQLEYDGAINYPEPIIPFEDIPYLLQIAEKEKVQALQEIE